MRRYEIQDVTVQREVALPAECDGCGAVEDAYGHVEVVITVHESEEGGGRDVLHFCDDCLLERASTLVAAGSTAELVAGAPQGPVIGVDERRLLAGRLVELRDQWACTADGGVYAADLTALLGDEA